VINKKNIRILFVDDEPSVLNSYKEYFEKEMTSFFASTPKEALDVIENEKIQILVTDYNLMSDKFGTDLINVAKNKNSNTRCILISGQLDLSLAKIMNKLEVRIFDKLTDNVTVGDEILDLYKLYQQNQEMLKNSLTGTMAWQMIHDSANSIQAISFGVEHTLKGLKTDKLDTNEAVIKLDKTVKAVKGFQDSQQMLKAKISGMGDVELTPYKTLEFINNYKEEAEAICANSGFNYIQELESIEDGDLIIVEPTLFKHVLNNLVTNSIHANKEKSGEKWIKLKFSSLYSDKLNITVTDSGSPLPLEIQQKLFVEEFTTKGLAGTGKGLSYCKKNIESFFGKIFYDAYNIENCSFKIVLPKQSVSDSISEKEAA
jgi:signal transduction histidine kinase